MRQEASILHADLDAFFASVEQRDRPELRGRPVIVGGGVVMAASYEARAYGVRSAMGGAQARRLCPQAVVVGPRFAAYSAASRAVFTVFNDITPLVEGVSIDEAFLDVGGLGRVSGSPIQIAARLRLEVLAKVGLAITVGVARTKFLAKVASRVAKPDGLLLVPPDQELEFLHPLRVESVWGVGPSTAQKLHGYGIATVGELAQFSEPALAALLGRGQGRALHALAHSQDPRPVQVGRRRRNIGAQRALGRSPRSAADIDTSLVGLVDRVTRRMRDAGRAGRTVTLRLRFADFTALTRSRTLGRPTDSTGAILDAARRLLAQQQPLIRSNGLTLIGISVGNFETGDAVQLELQFPDGDGAGRKGPGAGVDVAVDRIRGRFGSALVTRAVLLGRDAGIAMPTLPD